ncbi:hypothetical protein ABVF61_21505 [Roseibium sp. HPY-6]|uniref:hypothetical protein n=1 Tax=Roseibium sp. HPY-6 TaxID=3229852 RepID=UPI00338D386D
MLLLIGLGIFAYLAVALAFFALSAMELAETARAAPGSLSLALVTAVFWPITLSVMSALVLVTKTRHS